MARYLDELVEINIIDDVIQKQGIKIRVPKNTLSTINSKKRLDDVLKAIKNKIPPKHFKPDKKALKELGIKLPVSKSGKGLSVDFVKSKYLYQVNSKQKNIVKIKLTGDDYYDFKLANALGGFNKKPKGYTWHHLDDYDPVTGTCTMQLVESKIHQATCPHIGAVKIIEDFLKFKYISR